MRRISLLAVVTFVAALAACSPPQRAPAPNEEPAPATSVVVAAPAANARVTSPLIVEGTAPGDWYFEAQFPVQLLGADDAVLAEAPARPQSDWMTEAPVPFRAELAFSVERETSATLVLKEDMPADGANPRQLIVAVVLAPAP